MSSVYLEELKIWELWKSSDDENEYELSSDDENKYELSSGLSDEELESNVYVDESILNVWEFWKSANDQNSKELRSEAFEELKKCEENLSLRFKSLSTVPNTFPYGLKELNLASNQLTHIPDNLPETLEFLNMHHNRVCIIPDKLPLNLKKIQISFNKITNIPESLPDSITHLIIYNNAITILPNKLPKNLKRLDVCNNQLTNLPENLPESLEELEAGSNVLTNLPNNLPKSLRKLRVNNNEIKILSDTLPEMLEDFNIRNNKLSCLPAFPKLLRILQLSGNYLVKPKFNSESIIELFLETCGLETIDEECFHLPNLQKLFISGNKLTRLPRNLPDSLTCLYACNNNLSEIPNDLPSSLKNLDLDGNDICSLPEYLPPNLMRFSFNGTKFRGIPQNSPQSEQFDLLNDFITEMLSNIPDIPYTESRFENSGEIITIHRIFVHEYHTNENEIRPLNEEIANWINVESDSFWNIVSEDLNARSFSHYLYRLRQSPLFLNPEFKEWMSNWLCSLGEQTDSKQKLREKIFLVALEASDDEHVGWSLNQMKILSIAQDVESGKYDGKTEELIRLVRGIYRLQILVEISRQIGESLIDAIQKYFEYQIRLREIFNLPTDITKVSNHKFVLPDEHIEYAIKVIQDREQTEFFNYILLDCQPWKEVLKRWNHDEFVKCESIITNEEYFMYLLDKFKVEYLRETGLSEISLDIEVQIGAKILHFIKKDIWLTLTKEFLKSINLDDI